MVNYVFQPSKNKSSLYAIEDSEIWSDAFTKRKCDKSRKGER